MKTTGYCILIAICITFASCDRVKNKSGKAIDAVKTEAGEVADFIDPKFDTDKPDTDNNKAQFKKFINVPITPDIKNIYAYGDAKGADRKYQFSFNCDITTVNSIIKRLNLKLDKDEDTYNNGEWESFPWWDQSFVVNNAPYYRVINEGILSYLWYNTATKKAYFSVVDL